MATMTKVTAAGATHIGGSRNKENQDAFCINGRTVAVLDGHGPEGKAAAEKAKATFESQTTTETTALFAQADAEVLKVAGASSGATATLLQISEDGTCTVSHVGDSEAWAFDSDEGPGVHLGADHSAGSLEEWMRIRATATAETHFRFAPLPGGTGNPVFIAAADGKFVPNPAGGHFYCNVRHDWASYVCSRRGENLGITRALGDLNMKPHGVSALPSVVTKEAPAPGTVRTVVVASDGLWDAMLPDEVRAIVRRPEFLTTQDADAAVAALMAAALTKGNELFGTDHDNVTAVVVYIA
jgi:serine/threonine protein phosphatase PrpC